jgi:uncharacterized YccA/Bax inhibitor family protein
MSQTINSAFNRIDKNPWGSPVGSPMAPMQRFSATRAYDKLIALSTVVLVAAIFGWLVVPVGLAYACIFVAFGLAMVSWFRMGWAKFLAPAYAVTEGIALGAISAAYATVGHGIVPTAIVFTGAVFVACLFLYRTGLVRVTPRFASMAFIGVVGIVAVSILSLFISIPGVNSFGQHSSIALIFGVLCLGVAVLSLFTDFAYVQRSQALGASAEGEWAAAFAMLTALVLVYLSMLRILASAYGGRRS